MVFEIKIPIYKTSAFFYIGENIGVLQKHAKKITGLDTSWMTSEEGVSARVFLVKRLCFVNLKEDYTHEDVSHEMAHVTFDVLKNVGVTITDSSEEAFCYLLGYLISSFYKKVQK